MSSTLHTSEYGQALTKLLAAGVLCLAIACFVVGQHPMYRPWLIAGVSLWMGLLFLLQRARWITVPMVIAVAVLMRVVYLGWPPILSDDVYRYLWDGLLQHQGVNPYAFKPQDVEPVSDALAALYPLLNSPGYYSVYQPVSQLTFWLATWLAPTDVYVGYLIIKGVYTIVEMLGVVALLRMVPPTQAVLYAWCPFAVIEVAGQGHAEGVVVGAIGVAILAFNRQRWTWVGLAGAIAVWVKLLPLLVAPLFLRTTKWRNVLAASVAVSVVVWLPYAAPYVVENIRTSTDLYVRLFEFNPGPYLALKEALRWWTGEDWSKQLGPFLRSTYLLYCGILLGWAFWKRWELARGVLWITGGYLVFATTVHPWYILPVVYISVIAKQHHWFWLLTWSTATYLFYTHDTYWPFVWIGWGGWFALLVVLNRAHLLSALLRQRARRKAIRLQRCCGHLNASAKVLDIGAGEGYVAEHLARRTEATLHLTDVEATNKTNLPFTICTPGALPFEPKQFDVCYVYFVLHHAQDPEQLVNEALRVTKHRLIVAESVFTTESEYRRLKWLDERSNRLRGGWMTPQEEHLTFKRTNDWIQLIEAKGGVLVSREERGRWLHRQAYLVFSIPTV
ncbi:MAG: class I SAM-dependent methyltransferase [Bacteroidota bacterium]